MARCAADNSSIFAYDLFHDAYDVVNGAVLHGIGVAIALHGDVATIDGDNTVYDDMSILCAKHGYTPQKRLLAVGAAHHYGIAAIAQQWEHAVSCDHNLKSVTHGNELLDVILSYRSNTIGHAEVSLWSVIELPHRGLASTATYIQAPY